MNGRTWALGFLMGGLGVVLGWFIWGKSGAGEVKLPRQWIEKSSVGEAVKINGLGQFYKRWSEAEELEGALVGFCVLDSEGDLVYGSPLAETALCPASALKTLTAGAAFGLLGEEFRFQTELRGVGGLSGEGVVTGDLVLKGGGDPTLSERDLEKLAEEAVGKGLKRVAGTLRVDGGIFPENPVSDHWVWGDLGNAYGAGAFGLNVGHNVVRLIFDAGEKEGDGANWLRSEPDIYEKVDWDIAVRTGPAGSGDQVMVYSAPRLPWIYAIGTVPLGEKGFAVRAALPDPPRFAWEFLKKALESRGVVFSDDLLPNGEQIVLARHESAALDEIVRHMQGASDNLEAQCFFLMMGVEGKKDPAAVMRDYWEGMGVDFEGLRLLDGSGLARATMIRPVDLARVNFLARKSGYGQAFFESLPGSSNGSVRSKRGAMSGVRTEVGFVNRDGKEYTFALMGNGLGNVDFWKLRESLIKEVVR